MSSNKTSPQDKKDLEKFIKFLALKSTQVIIQARLGEKISTQCNPHTPGNDWFNLAIQDNPDVQAETKKVLSVNTGESITTKLPLCVEISLQTVEGDKMVLEVWSLGIIPDLSELAIKATYAVYNGMGILLKSLISVTRVTPAYKLSRRQSTDSYHIYYRIYVGEPQIHNLGDGYEKLRVGQLCTIIGILNMSVTYRTKMTISPTQTGRDNTIMLKSDHFLKDFSPKHIRYHHIKNDKKVIDLDKPMRPGAFVDTSRIKQYTEEDFILPETPPFSWLLRKPKEHSDTSTEDEKTSSAISPVEENMNTNNNYNHINNNNNNNNNNNILNNGNVKSFESGDVKMSTQSSNGVSPPNSLNSAEGKKQSRWSSKAIPPEDDRLLKELHFPFATGNIPISDLAKFYRDCFNAPPLQEFNESPIEEACEIDDISKLLEQFETSLGDYDTLVTSLCCQSVDNNNSS